MEAYGGERKYLQLADFIGSWGFLFSGAVALYDSFWCDLRHETIADACHNELIR